MDHFNRGKQSKYSGDSSHHPNQERSSVQSRYDRGSMEEGYSDRILFKEPGDRNKKKDVLEGYLDQMRSDPQAYEHHQLMLDGYLHFQPIMLSHKEIKPVAIGLMGPALAIGTKALQACRINDDISRQLVNQSEESFANCKSIFNKLEPFENEDIIYHCKDIWKLFTAIHKYQDDVSDLVDHIQKRQRGRIDVADQVLTQFENRNKQTVQDYLCSHESPGEVRLWIENNFKHYDINTGQISNNQKILEQLLKSEASFKQLQDLRSAIANHFLLSKEEKGVGVEHALMWWRVIDIEMNRKEMLILNNLVKNQSGIHIRAIINVNDKKSKQVKVTQFRQSSDSVQPMIYTGVTPIVMQQLRRSSKDAEVATIQDIEKELNDLGKKMKDRQYQSISIRILGQIGACSGCHYRIQEAAKRWRNSELSEILTVSSIYDAKPYIQKFDNRNNIPEDKFIAETEYGRANRAKVFERKQNQRYSAHTYYEENY